jgi:hypothetical protein
MAVEIKVAPDEKLELVRAQIIDTTLNSDYFNVTELSDTFSGGKNAFLIAGSALLEPNTEVKVQIRDSAGEVLYCEYSDGYPDEYYEGISKVVAVYVYPTEVAFGPATITLIGQIRDTLDLVKWERKINIDPSLPNTTKVRFYKRPTVSIVEQLSPIYSFDVNGSKVASNVTQSFANIKVSQLDTFAGDVKRVKVYRTSEGDISDYDLIQDILIESKELLTTTQLSGSVVGDAGLFTSETLNKLWNTGSLTAALTSSRIDNGLSLKGNGYLRYSSSLNFNAGNTYEFAIDAFYSASTASDMGIYVSGSQNGQTLIGTLNGVTPTKNLNDQVYTFTLDKTEPTASLYLSQSQSEWHVGNISLKLSEDSAFSPSEISFVTSMPTVLGNETYNFKFEFYDVNNNYVPVAVTQSALFTGGNNNINGTLTLISSSASSSNAALLALSQSVSGTIGTVTGSVSQSFVTSSAYSASLMTTALAFSSSASSSISQSRAAAISSSFGSIQTLANGGFSGSFIGETTIYAPVIGGNTGYISQLFKVGTAPSIYLDARQDPRKIFIGGVADVGSYNSSTTTVYMDSTGKFSLGNKLTWDGGSLTLAGSINITGGQAATDIANAAASGSNALNYAVSNNATASAIAAGQAATTAAAAANYALVNANTASISAARDAAGFALINANTASIFTDSSGKVNRTPATGTPGLYLGQTYMGYHNGNGLTSGWKTYMQNNGNFFLSGTNGFLSWNAVADTLGIKGDITCTNITATNTGNIAGWDINNSKIFTSNVEIDSTNNRIDFKSGGVVKTRIKSGAVNIGTTVTQAVTISGAGTTTNSFTGTSSTQYGPATLQTSTGGNTAEVYLTTPSGLDGVNLSLVIPYPAVTSLGLAQCFNMGTATSCQYGYNAGVYYVIRETNSVGNPVASGAITVANLEWSNNFTTAFGNVTLPGFSGGTITIPSIGTAVSGKVYWIQVYLGTTIKTRLNPNGTTPLGSSAGMYVVASGWDAVTANSLLLAVAARAEYGTNGVQIGSAEGTYVAFGDAAGSGNVGLFAGNVSVIGTIAAGSVTASDKRAKTNIIPISNGIETIKKLNPVSYDWLQHITGNFEFQKGYGFIADDIQKIMPELIYEKQGYTYKDFKHLDYTSFHAIAIKAIQELAEKIEKLEAQISGSK